MQRCNSRKIGIFLIVFIVLCVLALNSCGTSGEWEFYLPNEYYISRQSDDMISLISPVQIEVRPFETTYFVTEDCVTNFAYNNNYAAVQVVELPVDYNREYISDYIRTSTPTYILVDTNNHTIYNELKKEEYENLLSELQIFDMCDWITTSVRPKGAKYWWTDIWEF